MANVPQKKNSLGKGLSALLQGSYQDVQNKEPQELEIQINSIAEIAIENIETNPFQPRTDFDQESLQELAESIKVQGIIQPITVRILSKNKFQLISGERRTQAAKLAGLTKIPAYVRTANDQQMLEMGLIENIQRENLNAIEIALSYQRLISECNLKQDDLGERVGKKRSSITNYLRLLKLPPDIQISVRDGALSFGHARTLLGVENIEKQLFLFKQTIEEGLSVRALEELVKKSKGTTIINPPNPPVVSPEIKRLSSDLSSHFGSKISIKSNSDGKGEIKIPFISTEDLNRILDILKV